jgi:hypothetical protein
VDDLVSRARNAAAVLMAIVMLAAMAVTPVAQERVMQAPAVTHWCPMHPEVRGGAGDRCRLCSMALVPIAVADYEPYVLDIEMTPRVLKAGRKTRLRLTVRHPQTRALVRRFAVVHERVFHLFVLSDDHTHFAHVHPELKRDGTLEVDVRLPHDGAYRLIADFMPEGGTPQLLQRALVTAGYGGSLIPRAALREDLAAKTIGRSLVTLTTPEPVAGREQLITFDVHDTATGAPARLEPYLGATGHLLLVSGDLNVAFHSHPIEGLSTLTGPTVVFQVLFPRAGSYKLWAQFQRDGEILTVPYVVSVSARE